MRGGFSGDLWGKLLFDWLVLFLIDKHAINLLIQLSDRRVINVCCGFFLESSDSYCDCFSVPGEDFQEFSPTNTQGPYPRAQLLKKLRYLIIYTTRRHRHVSAETQLKFQCVLILKPVKRLCPKCDIYLLTGLSTRKLF